MQHDYKRSVGYSDIPNGNAQAAITHGTCADKTKILSIVTNKL